MYRVEYKMQTLSKSDRNKYYQFPKRKKIWSTNYMQCIYMVYLLRHFHFVLCAACYSNIPMQYARIILDFASRTSTITCSFLVHQKFMRISTSKRICVVLSTRMHYMKIKPTHSHERAHSLAMAYHLAVIIQQYI